MSFDENSFKEKIKKYGKGLGRKLLYNLFILFHLLKSKETPRDVKIMIISALGYFILPLDIIPDFLPGGFVDDGLVILTTIRKVSHAITPEIKEAAEKSVKNILE